MNEMQKRVQNAIRSKIKVDATGLAPVVASAFIIGIEEAAVAAMEAMRLPTDDMIQAGYDASESGLPLKKIHTAMIDAALRTE